MGSVDELIVCDGVNHWGRCQSLRMTWGMQI